MEDDVARCILERIDHHLRTGAQRSSASRADFLDALLELRLLTSDLITLGSLEASSEEPDHRRSPGWRAKRSRAG
jgi:hypothetical protein